MTSRQRIGAAGAQGGAGVQAIVDTGQQGVREQEVQTGLHQGLLGDIKTHGLAIATHPQGCPRAAVGRVALGAEGIGRRITGGQGEIQGIEAQRQGPRRARLEITGGALGQGLQLVLGCGGQGTNDAPLGIARDRLEGGRHRFGGAHGERAGPGTGAGTAPSGKLVAEGRGGG